MSLKIIKYLKNRVGRSDIARRMVSGLSWSLASIVAARVIVLLAGIVVARIMGQELYGEFGMAKSTLNMLMIFGSAGLGLTATKYIAEYRKDNPQKTSTIYLVTNIFAIVVAFVTMILVYVFADVLAVNLLHRESLVAPLKVVAIVLFFIIINLAQNGVLVGFEDFKNKSINTVIGYVIQSAAMIVGAYYWGIIGATIGYGIGFVSIMVLNKHTIDQNFKKIGVKHNLSSIKLADFKILFTYSLPAAISSILAAPTYWVIRMILVRNTSFSELAVYDVADQWRMFVLFIPSTICYIALPIMSSISNDNVRQFKKLLNSNILINMGIAMFAAIFLCLFSSIILSFYGKGYTDNMPFIIMAISSIFTSVSTMLGVSISSKAKMWTWCGFNILWGAIAIGSSYYFINVMGLGATGAAYGILISFIIHTILQYFYIQTILKSIKRMPSINDK